MSKAVPIKELQQKYHHLVLLALIHNHPVVEDSEGVWRWKGNAIIKHLLHNVPLVKHMPQGREVGVGGSYGIDLHAIRMLYTNGQVSCADYIHFCMDSGMSLDAFVRIFTKGSEKKAS